jgi:hypothetical protein
MNPTADKCPVDIYEDPKKWFQFFDKRIPVDLWIERVP